MKKLLTIAAFLCLMFVGKAKAEVNANIDLDKVKVSTYNWSSAASLATQKPGWLLGVRFSTGTCGDYVAFQDTGTATNTQADLVRLYNVVGTTTPVLVGPAPCTGDQMLKLPIPFRLGLAYKANSAAYNTIEVYWAYKP